MKTFEPKNVDLIGIFSENNRYEVPVFQRGYDWGEEQISNFWSDLESVKSKDKDTLFFGNFIFLNKDTSGKVLSIIDGQQRITTLQFLLIAIRARAKTLNEDALQIANVNNLIEYVTNKFAKQEKTGFRKLTAAKEIKPLFDIMSDYQWDGVIPEKLADIDGRKYGKMRRKVKPVYDFFHEKVRDLNTQELADILGSLEKIFITRIDLDDPQEAFDIFERTNARGVKLAQSDLVKNLLFQNAEESLHEEINDKWERITLNASDRLSQMLKYYVVSFNSKTLRKDIFPILRSRVRDQTSKVLIDDLLKFSAFYKMMSDEGTASDSSSMAAYFGQIGFKQAIDNAPRRNAISRSISAFQLFGITQVYPLIYAYIEGLYRFVSDIEGENKESKNRKSLGEYLLIFTQRLENFHFINTVIGDNIGNQVESLYANYAKELHEVDKFSRFIELEARLREDLLQLREKRKTFVSKFTDLSSEEAGRPLICYIFDRLSNAESSGDQIFPLYVPDKDIKTKSSNIEHFYPRKMFESEGDAVGRESGDNIGNLLVIPLHTNSTFQHASPSDKFKIIRSDPKYLANLGNRDYLIMQYSGEEWTKKLIETRATNLGQYAFDAAWNVNI